MKVSASKTATSPSCKTLCVILEKHEIDNEQKIENDLHTSIIDLKLFLC
jgi:hypothetical protein